jgi:hypothetical protein
MPKYIFYRPKAAVVRGTGGKWNLYFPVFTQCALCKYLVINDAGQYVTCLHHPKKITPFVKPRVHPECRYHDLYVSPPWLQPRYITQDW